MGSRPGDYRDYFRTPVITSAPHTARILTVTASPAVDLTIASPPVVPGDKLRCSPPRHDPCGGGINVARVVRELGGDALAVFACGGHNGRHLQAMLAALDVPVCVVPIEAETRVNITVDEQGSGRQFRFVTPGPVLAKGDLERLLAAVADAARAGDPPGYIVLSGSIPDAHARWFVERLADCARSLGARLVVDTSSKAFDAIDHAYLIKPNVAELEHWVGRSLPDDEGIVEVARRIIAERRAEIVLVSQGAGGVLLVTADRARRFAAPAITPRSTVGAGDSLVAGVVHALAQGRELDDAVRLGLAAAAATLMTRGTELAQRDAVAAIHARLSG